MTLGGRELPGRNCTGVGACVRCVLHVPLRHEPDRGSAESDQDICGIGRIALEITTQPADARGAHHVAAARGEMVETDRYIAAFLERVGGGTHLGHSFGSAWKRGVLD